MFGFPHSLVPRIEPLRESLAVDDIEQQLNDLFVELFEKVSIEAFDAINAGAPHLGTFDLVRRAMTADGLALLKSDREEQVTRYLHKAWVASDNQGRGLHFLRTYLQMLYPNEWQLFQLEQDKSIPYPYALRHDTGNRETHFLTSRLSVLIDGNAANAPLLGRFVPILTSVIAARLVVAFETYKMLYINGICGAQLEMLGIANPRLELGNDNIRADVRLDAAWGGHAQGTLLPQGLTALTMPGAAFFMSNYYAPIECPAVCIVSRDYCCDTLNRLEQTIELVIKPALGVGLALHIDDVRQPGVMPQALTMPGAAFFMSNYYAPIECPAVCIVSRDYCCNPERLIDRLTEAVVRVKHAPAASVLGVLFDKRIPVASGWPDEWQTDTPQGSSVATFGQIYDQRVPLLIGWPYGVDTSVPPKSSQEASVGGAIVAPQ